jgi:ribosome-associated toxin RatA of RatAB toxin-antitoxin module
VPRVTVELDVSVPVDEVWERISDFGSYPQFMGNVDWVEDQPSRGDHRVTSWQVRLKGSILRWTDESISSKERWTIEFFQIDGDLERFDGAWTLAPIGADTTHVRLVVDFEIGIPQLRALLNPASGAAITENCENMLRDLEQSATRQRAAFVEDDRAATSR